MNAAKSSPARPAPGAFDIARETTPVRIAARLRDEIAQGNLLPGTRIHEVDYTAAFNVSRHSLREAISLLVAEGLLTRTSFKGVEVKRLSAADVHDIYAARRLIELTAVDAFPHAAPVRRRAVLEAIAALNDLAAPIDSRSMNEADLAVHMALVAIHGSQRIMGAYRALVVELQILLFQAYPPDDVASSLANHAAFGRMLEQGDIAGARAQLDGRLRRSEEELIARFGA